jgi:hypothetical protein
VGGRVGQAIQRRRVARTLYGLYLCHKFVLRAAAKANAIKLEHVDTVGGHHIKRNAYGRAGGENREPTEAPSLVQRFSARPQHLMHTGKVFKVVFPGEGETFVADLVARGFSKRNAWCGGKRGGRAFVSQQGKTEDGYEDARERLREILVPRILGLAIATPRGNPDTYTAAERCS